MDFDPLELESEAKHNSTNCHTLTYTVTVEAPLHCIIQHSHDVLIFSLSGNSELPKWARLKINKEEKKKFSVWSLLMCEAYFMIKLSCNNTTPNGSRVKTKSFCYLYADNTDTTNRDR